MAQFVVDLICGSNQWGWTETYYYDGNDPTSGAPGDSLPIRSLCAARRGLMARNVAIQGITVKAIGPIKASQRYTAELGGGPGTLVGRGKQFDDCVLPHLALMYEIFSPTKGTHAMRALRGLPSSMLEVAFEAEAAGSPFATDLVASFGTFRESLGALKLGAVAGTGPWLMKAREEAGDGRTTGYVINRVVPFLTTGELALELPDAGQWCRGALIEIHFPRSCSLKGMSGVHRLLLKGLPPAVPTPKAGYSWWVPEDRVCCPGVQIRYNGRGRAYMLKSDGDPSLAVPVLPSNNYTYKPIAWTSWLGVRLRDTGRQGLITRGRNRGRTCPS